MNRILLLTHRGLGQGFWAVLEHIFGAVPEGVELHEIAAEADLAQEKELLGKKMTQLAPADRLLILVDLYGATPSNVVPKELLGERVRLVTGINLPLLLRALSRREMPTDLWVEAVLEGGRSGIRAFPES